MNNSELDQTLIDILSKDSEGIIRWLGPNRETTFKGLPKFNWLGLAYSTAQRAMSERDHSVALNWATIASFIFDRLINQAQTDDETYALLTSLLNLRSSMITKLGPKFDGDITDVDKMIGIFSSYLPMSYEQAVQMLRTINVMSRDEVLRLRRIKNMINAIDRFDNQALWYGTALSKWLPLKDTLP